jgi:hypothetical protein
MKRGASTKIPFLFGPSDPAGSRFRQIFRARRIRMMAVVSLKKEEDGMDKPDRDDGFLPLSDILETLSRMRDKLIEINETSGHIANYVTMRREIEALGWGGILAKYHPDINVDDPAALPLFELYRFVYNSMKNR